MSKGRTEGRSGNSIPDPDGLIPAGCNHISAVGTEGHSVNPVVVPKWRRDRPTGGCIPDPGGLIEASCDDSRTVGTEYRDPHFSSMLQWWCRHFPCVHVPDAGPVIGTSSNQP